jgi:uncharacterized protein (TIGR04255 family)
VVFEQAPAHHNQLQQNPLKLAVAQLRFPVDFRLAQPEVLAALQAAFAPRYPVVSQVQQMSIEFGFGPGIPPTVREQPVTQPPTRFADPEGRWAVTVALEALSLETSGYTNWDDFLGRFLGVVESVSQHAPLGQAQRLGLRYVNELTHPEATSLVDWARFLTVSALGSAGSVDYAPYAARAQDQVTMLHDDVGATLRHRYQRNADGDDARSTFVIDTDVFSPRPFVIDPPDLLERLNRFHDVAWTIFRGSVTDELIEWFGRARP